MTRAKGLSCHEEHEIGDYVTTAAARIVRTICPILRERELATLLDDPETGEPIDLEAEARRIFRDDLAEPRQAAPDPPTLDELGLVSPAEFEAATTVTADEIAASREDHVQAAYLEWVKTADGRTVAKEIRDRALELRRRGWSSYGIQAIAEVVRFDHAIRVGPDAAGYRVNNSHLSRLSRDLMAHYPELAGFFEVRELRT